MNIAICFLNLIRKSFVLMQIFLPKLLSSLISFLSCSWLQPPCIPSLSSFSLSSLPLPPCFPSLSSSFLLGGCWQLSPCFPVLSSFSPFMILYLWFLYLFMCSYVMLALYACYWFMSSSMVPFYSPFFCNLCGMMLSGVYAGVIL